MAKVITKAEHRFNRTVTVGQWKVFVDKQGVATVPSEAVAHFLLAGFTQEAGDKTQYTSIEQQNATQKVEELISAARAEAAKIVEQAKQEADTILNHARIAKVEKNEADQVDEKKEYLKTLGALTKEQLKADLDSAGVPREEWENLTKKDLIELSFKTAFPE